MHYDNHNCKCGAAVDFTDLFLRIHCLDLMPLAVDLGILESFGAFKPVSLQLQGRTRIQKRW